jgi:tetratricopeptide (TPR) repeat protein
LKNATDVLHIRAEMKPSQDFGERLRQLRLAAGLTQKQLAEPRYSHAFVSTIEAGRRKPSPQAVAHLAEKLHIDPTQLVTGRPPDFAARLELAVQEARRAVSAGEHERATELLAEVVRDARQYRLARAEANALVVQALVDERLGRVDEALDRYEEAERVLASDPLPARADALAGRARCLVISGDLRYAIHLLESAIEELHRSGLEDPGALMRLHASLVAAYFEAGLMSKAAESADEAMRLAPKVKETERVAATHINVAAVLLAQGQVRDAEDALRRSQELYRLMEFESEVGSVYLARGTVARSQGKLGVAKRLLRRGLQVLERCGDVVDLARALIELASVERMSGERDAARGHVDQAIQLLRDAAPGELARGYRERALSRAPEEPDAAEKDLREAIALFERAEESVQLAATCRELGDLLHERQNVSAAVEAYRRGLLAIEPF